MDKKYAESLLGLFKKNRIMDLTFDEYVGHGKSAAVFKVRNREGQYFAAKVYDPQLSSKYGMEVQYERLKRELSLKDHDCQYLVKIYDGGKITIDNYDYYYLLTEFVKGIDLRETIGKLKYKDDEIRKILLQLYQASDYLLKIGLCHRDIKVDNIRKRENGDIVLLDLGVLKPIAGSNITDNGNGRHFIGTLRYSPPEILYRREKDDNNGWYAITIYQIGTVLYELIQGAILFGHVNEPFADLVDTVNYYEPPVVRRDIGNDLKLLTKKCLVKDPDERLSFVNWNDIPAICKSHPEYIEVADVNFDKLMQEAQDKYEKEIKEPERIVQKIAEKKAQIIDSAQKITGEVISSQYSTLPFQPIINHQQSHLHEDNIALFRHDLKHRVVGSVLILVRIIRKQMNVGQITVSGVGAWEKLPYSENDFMLTEKRNKSLPFEIIWNDIFDASIYRAKLMKWIKDMISKYFEISSSEYDKEIIKERERIEGSGNGARQVRVTQVHTYVFNTNKLIKYY